MQDKSFDKLSDEFNAIADSWLKGGNTNAAALVTRFNILLRHFAENDADKRALTGKLLDTTEVRLGMLTATVPSDGLTEFFTQQYVTVLDAMVAPEVVGVLPKEAPRMIAGVALDVLGLRTKGNLTSTERETYTAFSGTLLSYADKFAAAIATRTYATATSQDIAPAKPITLKPKTSPDT